MGIVSEDPNSLSVDALAQRIDFLRRLAAGLVGDRGADDLAQAALLDAMTRPPRNATSITGWLRQVLENRFRQEFRQASRRKARERVAYRAGVSVDPAEVVERFEEARRAIEAVRALEEPYRNILLMRYLDDQDAATIARTLGIPASTVRNRLRHALAVVRARLDEEHGGDRRRWVVGMLLIASGSRRRVPDAWRASGFVGAAVVTVGVVAILGAGLRWWPGGDPADKTLPAARPAKMAPVKGTTRHRIQLGTPPVSAITEELVEGSATAPPRWLLDIRLLRIDPDAPVSDDAVRIEPRGPVDALDAKLPVRRIGFDRFTADLTSLREGLATAIDVVIDDSSYAPLLRRVELLDQRGRHPGARAAFEVVAPLQRTRSILGMIVDEDDIPLPEIKVTLQSQRAGTLDEARTDEAGRYLLRSDQAGALAVLARQVVAARRLRPTAALAVPDSAGDRTIEMPRLRLIEGAGVIRGRVVNGGNPAPGARVTTTPRQPHALLEGPSNAWIVDPRPAVESTANELGEFVFEGLVAGVHILRVVSWRDAAILDARAVDVVTPAMDALVEIDAALVTVRVSGQGEWLESAAVAIGKHAELWTNPRGSVRIVLPRGSHDFGVRARGRESWRGKMEIATNEPSTRVVELRRDRRMARVVIDCDDSDGPGVGRIHYELHVEGRDFPIHRETIQADRNGAFAIEGLEAGRYRIRVLPGAGNNGRSWFRPVGLGITLREGEQARRSAGLVAGGRLAIEAMTPTGVGLAAAFSLRSEDARVLTPEVIHDQGISYHLERRLSGTGPAESALPLLPGRYRIECTHPGFRSGHETVELRPFQMTRVRLVLEPE